MGYFAPRDGASVRAVPGSGLSVPIYILGSSTFGAQVAAALGLPFAFASHFAPAQMMPALQMYRSNFRASAHLARPHSILGVNVVAAETDEQARFLATSGRESFANLRRGMPTTLPPPNREFEREIVEFGRVPLEEVNSIAMVGSASTVLEGFRRFIALTSPDELMVVSHIYDHGARVRSFEIVAEVGAALV
jgi:luciferase family oxidoreductase group 1